jgi:hypothetical protein
MRILSKSLCFISLFIPFMLNAGIDFNETIRTGKLITQPSPTTPTTSTPQQNYSQQNNQGSNRMNSNPSGAVPDQNNYNSGPNSRDNDSYQNNYNNQTNSIPNSPDTPANGLQYEQFKPSAPPMSASSPSAPSSTLDKNAGSEDFVPAPPRVLTEEDRKIIAKAQQEDSEMLKVFNKDLKTNFDTYTFPKEYYEKPFDKTNSHLPAVDFASYYAALAFRYVREDRHINVKYFIDRYNFRDITNPDGNNLLMTAAAHDSIKSARMLLMRNIFSVNEQNPISKQTSLHYAVNNGSLEMTKILLTMGASPLIPDAAGNTAIDYALQNNNNDISQILLAYKKSP